MRPERGTDGRPLTYGEYKEYVLSRHPSAYFEVFLGVLPPGTCEAPQSIVYGDSEEFCYVISGTVQMDVGEDVFTLNQGDVLEYYTSVPHRAKNSGSETAEILWVIGPPTVGRNGDELRQNH